MNQRRLRTKTCHNLRYVWDSTNFKQIKTCGRKHRGHLTHRWVWKHTDYGRRDSTAMKTSSSISRLTVHFSQVAAWFILSCLSLNECHSCSGSSCDRHTGHMTHVSRLVLSRCNLKMWGSSLIRGTVLVKRGTRMPLILAMLK